MFNVAGTRGSLLNGKVRAITRSLYDDSIGNLKKQKVNFSLLPCGKDMELDDKKIVVIYMIDIKLHESHHDDTMMQQLNLILINIHIRYTKVIFRNHDFDKNKFNKIYNLIRLNLPEAVIDVFPKDVNTVYDYIEKFNDDDNHYITFHPYINSIEIMDVLFENTILNTDNYRRYISYFNKTSPEVASFLCLGVFLHPSQKSFWFDYAWITKCNNSSHENGKRIYKSIFKFERDNVFASISQIEASEFILSE